MTTSLLPGIEPTGSAVFSPCGLFRYVLRRGARVHEGCGLINFVMLNPSTADATQDDPTIRRCIGYAWAWDFVDLVVTNLFGLRSTDPAALKTADDPIGPENDRHILEQAKAAQLVVCGWGVHGAYLRRGDAVLSMFREAGIMPYCLTQTGGGHPGHPLYLPAGLKPRKMEGQTT